MANAELNVEIEGQRGSGSGSMPTSMPGPAPARRAPGPHLRIEPSRGWAPLNIAELWRYRELLVFMAWRDIAIRYKQTGLGIAWAVLQPLMMTVVFTLFFGRLAGMPSDGQPYFLFSLIAMAPWTLFESGLTQASNSLVSSSNLIKKVYFPRLAVPISAVISCIPDFLVALGLAVLMMAINGAYPTINSVWLPLFALLGIASALGIGLWLSAMNVWYRDVKYVVPFVTRFWMFASPVLYPASKIPDEWKTVYALNPMVTVIEGFRWGMLGTDSRPGLLMIASSTVASLALLISGAYYFRRMEKSFADVV